MNVSELVRNTPVLRAENFALKLENLQRTGSFKLRGAVAKLSALSGEERLRGVVASSAGNHGAGVALAARALAMRAIVVVPRLAPAVKRRRIADLGAEVIVAGEVYDEAEARAVELAAERGAVFVSPYDDDLIVEGNGGGVADELIAQVSDLARVVVAVGGGGLIGGLAARLAPRGVEVLGAQPETNCAMHESLRLGRALTEYTGGETLAEGCEGAVSERTYQLVREHVTDIALVSEAAIRRAVRWCYADAAQIVECSAAVGVAALLEGAVTPAAHGTTVVVVTGGNIEPAVLDGILAGG